MLNRHFLYFCLCSYVHKLIAHIILDSAHIRPKIHLELRKTDHCLKNSLILSHIQEFMYVKDGNEMLSPV